MAQLVSALFYGSFFLPREGSSYLNDLIFFFTTGTLRFQVVFSTFLKKH